MRINKTTEAYIYQLIVDKAIEAKRELNKEKDALEEKRNAPKEKFLAEVNKYVEECKQKCDALMKKMGMTYDNEGRWYKPAIEQSRYDDCSFHLSAKDSARMSELVSEIRRIDGEVENKHKEIVARLSLGGTAKDLDEMLANIKF